MFPKKTTIALTGAALVITLSACSSGGGTPTPSPTAPTTPMAQKDVRAPETKTDATCTDGVAEITESNTEITLPGACRTVTVSANNAIVHLGDVRELTVTGGLTRVLVDTADTVRIDGNGNDVLWGVEKPINVDDRGEQNFVQKTK